MEPEQAKRAIREVQAILEALAVAKNIDLQKVHKMAGDALNKLNGALSALWFREGPLDR